mmetsp:Transcript_43193/g.60589  ORF Transcript_43193/g.60589 Transcript_43193/m.60589 type:complete len:300 (+) Transcript_43193:37-936(+)
MLHLTLQMIVRFIICSDIQEPSTKRRKVETSVSSNIHSDEQITNTRSRIAKVSAANLPQEYLLVRLLAEVNNLDESWSLHTPACEWEGVSCNEREEVSHVRWTQRDLSGTMNLIYLPHSLYDFDVCQNALEGTAPLTRLPSELRSLTLYENRFAGELDLIFLPLCFEDLTLNDNRFNGTVCLTSLPVNMRNVNLSENRLTGPLDLTLLPPNICQVYLSGNQLSGELDLRQLPSGIRHLDLSRNMFSGDVNLAELPSSLLTFNLSDNVNLRSNITRSPLPENVQEYGLCVYNTQIRLENH